MNKIIYKKRPQFTFSADYKAFFEVLNKAEIIISSPLQYFRHCFFCFSALQMAMDWCDCDLHS